MLKISAVVNEKLSKDKFEKWVLQGLFQWLSITSQVIQTLSLIFQAKLSLWLQFVWKVFRIHDYLVQ